MIRAEHLFKRYGNHEVVSDLSFTVQKGEILGFIGANGAGKSTTIKMLCGVLPIYDGKIEICGIDMANDPLLAKSKIGYLPENAPLPSGMTVLSFLEYTAAMHGLSNNEKNRSIAQALERCSLNDVTGTEIETLSKGYQRRVCLAQALLHEPEVLLLDEPTDGLDPMQKREIRNLIQILCRKTAIVISTHILEEVRSVCTNVLLLSHGKSVFHGPVEDFLKQAQTMPYEAITLRSEDLPTAIALLRKCCPGKVRISGNQIALPGLKETDTAISLLAEKGVKPLKRESTTAGLDDVFASFTTPIKPNSVKEQRKASSVTQKEDNLKQIPEGDDD